MSLGKELMRGLVPAMWVGVGAVLSSPQARSRVVNTSRPVLKGAIRCCLELGDKINELVGETREQWSDLVAEVQAERAAPPATPEAKPTPTGGTDVGKEMA